jgi:hypothetical protein
MPGEPGSASDLPLLHNRIHQTNPILVHAPGKLEESPWWEAVKQRVFENRRVAQGTNELAIITWNSGAPNRTLAVRGHTLGWFERSLDHSAVSYTVLGGDVGTGWTNRLKLDLTLDFLGRTTAQFILGGDSSDVLLVGDPARALAEFLRQDAGVLFNAEKNPWPKQLADVKRFERRVALAPFYHLNAGLWIGRREALIRAFTTAKRWAGQVEGEGWRASEQVCWKLAYRELYPEVQVDDRCRIFQTLIGVRREVTIAGQRWPLFPWGVRPGSGHTPA